MAAKIHHSAICVRDFDASLRFYRDGLGLSLLWEREFEGDWPTLFGAPEPKLHSAFLGDPAVERHHALHLVPDALGVVTTERTSVFVAAGLSAERPAADRREDLPLGASLADPPARDLG